MKRFLFVTAALLAMSVSFCFGQSKEDIKASIDRCAKLEKLCSKQPKQTGIADVDSYVQEFTMQPSVPQHHQLYFKTFIIVRLAKQRMVLQT